MDKLVAFILTNGRPNKVITYKYLRKCGYTGRIVIVIDDEDPCGDEYRKNFPGEVVSFSKSDIATRMDEGDNFGDRRAIVYARNACFEIAEKLGIKYFVQLDDDYNGFMFRFDGKNRYNPKPIRDLDRVFAYMLDYYKSIPAAAIAMAQGGDFIGGANGGIASGNLKMKRKCMNSFFCSTERPFKFVGRVNEDVNTYTCLASRGLLFLTIPNVCLNQITTQKNKGGMSEMYLDSGTYVKSFYSVMYSPSCVRIGQIGTRHKRLHHSIDWDHAVPVIVDAKHKRQ